MFRLTLKQLLAHRARLILTLLAVVLGITFVTGSLVLTDTSQKLFDEQFRTAAAGVDLNVRDAAAFDSAMGVEVERDPLPADLTGRVAAVPGVAEARPAVNGQGLLQSNGTAIVPNGPSILQSWAPAPFGAYTVRTGRTPTSTGEVVVDAATAGAHDITIGAVVTVIARTTEQLRVVGIAGFGDQDGLPNATVALVALPQAQRLLGLGDAVSEIQVIADPGPAGAGLRDRLASTLGADYQVSGSKDTAAASAAAAQTKLGYLRLMLLALAGAALLIGAFLIVNTFSIVIGQRTREFALLRAAGATGGQIVRSVLGEAAVIGLVGAVLGTALGVAAAVGLRDLSGAFGIALPDGGIVVTGRTVAVALTIGLLVTVLSALGPARRAARIAPVEAMRQSTTAAPVAGRVRIITGVITLAVGAAGLTAVVFGAGILFVGIGAVSGVVGLTLLGPALAPRLARVIGRPLRAVGVTGRLATQSAARAPRRTAATAMALALGLALISFMTIVASSVKDSIAGTYTEVITADYVIESARAEMLGGLGHQVHEQVEALPEVTAVSRLRYGHWKDNAPAGGGITSALTAVDPATLGSVTNLHMVAGSISDLSAGGVVLAAHVAAERGLTVGDSFPMTFSRTGNQNLPIVGLVADLEAQALSTDYLISLDTYTRQYTEDVDASVFVKVADGVDPAAALAALDRALVDQPTAEVRDQAAAVAGRTAAVDQILGLVTVLLLLAVLIALLGITNTLALSIVERTRELGLLRAIGMTRSQLRWMVRGEAVLIAGLAVVIGVGLGSVFGAAAVSALGGSTPIPVTVPVDRLVLVIAVATVAGLLAGLLPARRAARLDVLTAIATD